MADTDPLDVSTGLSSQAVTELHNAMVPVILRHMINPMSEAGAGSSDLLVLSSESVALSILMFTTQQGCSDDIVPQFMERLELRWKHYVSGRTLAQTPCVGSS